MKHIQADARAMINRLRAQGLEDWEIVSIVDTVDDYDIKNEALKQMQLHRRCKERRWLMRYHLRQIRWHIVDEVLPAFLLALVLAFRTWIQTDYSLQEIAITTIVAFLVFWYVLSPWGIKVSKKLKSLFD